MKHTVKEIPKEEILANRSNAYEFIDFDKQETLEEAAERYNSQFINQEENKFSKEDFINGAKWQQERSYSDMQEYAEFCIECDRKQMPLLLVQDWYEHYKE